MRILVVEDEHKIAQTIKKGLVQEGFAVDLAFDGREGFDLASVEDYDVIVLDLMLPIINGWEICKKLRQEENINTPILILSARGELDDRVKGLNGGADDYLVKPFAFAELVARIRALARRPKQSLPTILESGQIKMDLVNLAVTKGKKIIALSKKEFSLLEYLLRNKGRIVTKDQIISHVWNYEADILPNTVEVYIGYLRNKLGKLFIKTVRGFGYKIE